MKRASYREAIRWIAENDSSGDDLTEEECGSLVTSILVANIFDVDSDRVGRDVLKARKVAEKAREQRRRSLGC